MSRPFLHAAMLVVGVILAGAAILVGLTGCSQIAAGLAGFGLVLIVGVIIERWRYKPVTEQRPGPGWVVTDERFVDPETGRLVTVYYHPMTGDRRYVAA